MVRRFEGGVHVSKQHENNNNNNKQYDDPSFCSITLA